LADASGDNFKLGVVLYDSGRTVPFGDRLVAAPSLVWGLDSIFAVVRRRVEAGVAIRHYIPGSDDGLDFQAICRL
jgi:hypothetical protein